MPSVGVKEIRDTAKTLLASNPGGIRFKQLVNAVYAALPDANYNTVFAVVSNLHLALPGEIIKPSRGLFQLVGAAPVTIVKEDPPVTPPGHEKVYEHQFYKSFAEWLKSDLDEVTEVVALGGAGLKSKWGTPDVVGVYKPQAANLIKFPLEIVAAELKIDPLQPVVAFGQATAYRLFSHKVYIAMPNSLTEEDKSRLEALCMLFGVGLALFELDVDNPNYAVRVRAQRVAPDMFYVNDFADRLKAIEPEKFEQLFR